MLPKSPSLLNDPPKPVSPACISSLSSWSLRNYGSPSMAHHFPKISHRTRKIQPRG